MSARPTQKHGAPARRGTRPDATPSLSDECQYLKGVGPARAVHLKALGIESVHDLLTHFPRRYYDRRHLKKIGELIPGVEETVMGRVLTATRGRPRGRRTMTSAAIGDDTGVIQVVWFNQPYLLQHLKPGAEVLMSGTLRFFRGQRQLANPEFEIVGEELDGTFVSSGRIVPVYRLTSGVSQRALRALILRTLDTYQPVCVENLPEKLVNQLELPPRGEAMRFIHYPEDEHAFAQARRRIKVEELFYMQLVLSLSRRFREQGRARVRLDVPFEMERRFIEALPFQLTHAQTRVLDEIRSDLRAERGMHRLLQGDVGSGKTVVAGAAMLSAVEAGGQAAIMVPTEILAIQHFHTLAPLYEKLGVRCVLLVGSLKAAEKRAIHAAIAAGEVDVAIGTHALIQDDVKFPALALAVIDEQHRFGVRQRAAFLGGDRVPHILVMTATPIPRTLALTAYADLDLSVIDQMPATRAPVKTRLVPPDKRESMYRYIKERAADAEQTFLLYPVIEETEKQDLEAAQTAYSELASGLLKGVGLGLMHGRMSMADKDRVMRAFVAGDLRVLVATTVVEVGLHVPNATTMVVHHPERFGLSQLHQLRGRVGRGGKAGYCFLAPGDAVAPETMARLEVLVHESDGFRIAEADLEFRGPGEFLGVRQHGVPGFKLANPVRDRPLVEAANTAVRELLDADARLSGSDGHRCRAHLAAILSEETGLRGLVKAASLA